jgi:hypothetical protein
MESLLAAEISVRECEAMKESNRNAASSYEKK